jgi:hypothetical protein
VSSRTCLAGLSALLRKAKFILFNSRVFGPLVCGANNIPMAQTEMPKSARGESFVSPNGHLGRLLALTCSRGRAASCNGSNIQDLSTWGVLSKQDQWRGYQL